MSENENSLIEQEEAKMERRQFFKVSAKYGFTTAVVPEFIITKEMN